MITLELLKEEIEKKLKIEQELDTKDEGRRKEFEKMFKKEQDLKLLASQGSIEARQYLKNKIYLLICSFADVGNNNINELIKQYHLDYFQNIFVGNLENQYKEPIDKEIETYFSKFSISEYDSLDKKKSKLAQIIYQELFGYSVIDELVFESIFDEVGCNNWNYTYVQYKGVKRKIPNIVFRFKNQISYNKIIENRIVSSANAEMNPETPIIYCKLNNGYRVTALRPNLSETFVVSIRLFNFKELSEDQKDPFMPAKFFELIRILHTKGKRNFCIIGEMGSGKTTFAREIIGRMDKDTTIGVAENIHELEIRSNYPEKNVIELQYFNEKHTPSEITEMFFRLNRDVLIYGEVRGHIEAFEVIKAMLRLAKGSVFTFHTSSSKRLIHDLRQLLMQTGFYSSYTEAQFDVADAIDYVVHIKLDKSTGRRYVHKITEIVTFDDLTYSVKNLIAYDKMSKKYKINISGINDCVLKDCVENYEMDKLDIERIKEILSISEEEKNILEYFNDADTCDID